MVTALYRRYRPETFAQMIGQSQVTEPLMTALRAGRLGHAYLFSGPRGCGKTTSARVLARCLNCHQGPTDTPCGECPSCVELGRDGGGSLDVIEIDAASHGGVDDARELRERAVFAPARDRYKIFIIDEAHMVTKEGFNALLKIVEEPPEHVKFIFATTEPEKVIGTIRSRTHLYPFRLVAPAPLLQYLEEICSLEGAELESGVLPLVVRAGGGSVRDTLSILDQLIAGSEGSKVSLEMAVGILGYTPEDLLDDIILGLGERDAARVVAGVDRVIQTGQDPRRFVEDLLERLRDLIIVQATSVEGAATVLRGLSDGQLERLFKQASLFARATLSRAADIVSDSLDAMVGATAPQLQLELMMARVLVALGERFEKAAKSGQPVKVEKPVAAPEERAVVAVEPAGVAAEAAAVPAEAVAEPAESVPVKPAPVPAEPAAVPEESGAVAEGSAASFDFATAASSARAFLGRDPVQNVPAAASTSVSSKDFTLENVRALWANLASKLPATAALQKAFVTDVQEQSIVVAFSSREHLAQFKQESAATVRSEIENYFAVSFNFVPKLLSSDAIAQLRRESGEGVDANSPAEHIAESTPAIPPTRQSAPTPQPVSEPGPEPGPEPVTPDPGPEPVTPDPGPEAVTPDPGPEAVAPEAVPEAETPIAGVVGERHGDPLSKIERYGESVVREHLNAKFVKEIRVEPGEG